MESVEVIGIDGKMIVLQKSLFFYIMGSKNKNTIRTENDKVFFLVFRGKHHQILISYPKHRIYMSPLRIAINALVTMF